MKNSIILLLITFCVLTSVNAMNTFDISFQQQNDSKIVSFKVWGNCGSCKKNIEKALKVKGVTKVDWNKSNKMITVTFNESIITIDKIHSLIAKAGYDTDKVKGDDKAYSKLDACCQYERR
jgi:copper chaperone CopZ